MVLTDSWLRSSTRRWTQLSALLAAVERGVDASARLDARQRISGRIGKDHEGLGAFNAQLSLLERRIDRELDTLTAELLRSDVARKQHRALGVVA